MSTRPRLLFLLGAFVVVAAACSGTSSANDAEPSPTAAAVPDAPTIVSPTASTAAATSDAPASNAEPVDTTAPVPAPPEVVQLIGDGIEAGGVDPAALDGFDVDLDDATWWGGVDLYGTFVTEEVSGCWTDTSTLFLQLDVYVVDGVLIGVRVPERGDNAALTHSAGPRCGSSDQGEVITDDESIDVRLVGYHDTDTDRYGFLLAPTDATTYRLASGGEIGTLSFLATYLPSLQAPLVGSVTAMSVDAPTVEGDGHVLFFGELGGSGSTTTSTLVVGFRSEDVPPDPIIFDIVEAASSR